MGRSEHGEQTRRRGKRTEEHNQEMEKPSTMHFFAVLQKSSSSYSKGYSTYSERKTDTLSMQRFWERMFLRPGSACSSPGKGCAAKEIRKMFIFFTVFGGYVVSELGVCRVAVVFAERRRAADRIVGSGKETKSIMRKLRMLCKKLTGYR